MRAALRYARRATVRGGAVAAMALVIAAPAQASSGQTTSPDPGKPAERAHPVGEPSSQRQDADRQARTDGTAPKERQDGGPAKYEQDEGRTAQQKQGPDDLRGWERGDEGAPGNGGRGQLTTASTSGSTSGPEPGPKGDREPFKGARRPSQAGDADAEPAGGSAPGQRPDGDARRPRQQPRTGTGPGPRADEKAGAPNGSAPEAADPRPGAGREVSDGTPPRAGDGDRQGPPVDSVETPPAPTVPDAPPTSSLAAPAQPSAPGSAGTAGDPPARVPVAFPRVDLPTTRPPRLPVRPSEFLPEDATGIAVPGALLVAFALYLLGQGYIDRRGHVLTAPAPAGSERDEVTYRL